MTRQPADRLPRHLASHPVLPGFSTFSRQSHRFPLNQIASMLWPFHFKLSLCLSRPPGHFLSGRIADGKPRQQVWSVRLPWFCGKPAWSAASRTKSPFVGRDPDFWVCQARLGMEGIDPSSGGPGLGRPGPPELLSLLIFPWFDRIMRSRRRIFVKISPPSSRYLSWSK